PARPLLVDVKTGTVGGLELGQTADAYVRTLGAPDYSGAIESPKQRELLWTAGASPRSGWSVLTLTPSSVAGAFRFAGRFTTTHGDRPGTPLATFRRQWAPTRSVHA